MQTPTGGGRGSHPGFFVQPQGTQGFRDGASPPARRRVAPEIARRQRPNAASCGTDFRYDAGGNRYHYNLRTRDLEEGRYRVTASLRNYVQGHREFVLERK